MRQVEILRAFTVRFHGNPGQVGARLDEPDVRIEDFGDLRCSCDMQETRLCSHRKNYVLTEWDRNLLSVTRHFFVSEGIRDSSRWLKVDVPLILPHSSYVLDKPVVFVSPVDERTWKVEMEVSTGFYHYLSHLGLVPEQAFSRRSISRRVAQALLAIAMQACRTCGYKPTFGGKHPVELPSDDRHAAIKRGAIMARGEYCDICVDMTQEVSRIHHV